MLHVLLDLRVGELAPDEALGVEDRVARVGVEGVFGGLANSAEDGQWACGEVGEGLETYNRSSSPKLTQEGVILFP